MSSKLAPSSFFTNSTVRAEEKWVQRDKGRVFHRSQPVRFRERLYGLCMALLSCMTQYWKWKPGLSCSTALSSVLSPCTAKVWKQSGHSHMKRLLFLQMDLLLENDTSLSPQQPDSLDIGLAISYSIFMPFILSPFLRKHLMFYCLLINCFLN